MRVACFTATRQYGGLAETKAALCRQEQLISGVDEIIWIIGDDLFHHRDLEIYEQMRDDLSLSFLHFDAAYPRVHQPELKRTLAHAYNQAFAIARSRDVDLFVSLQDYVIPPNDGIARFIEMAEMHPDSLLTGLMSFSTKPDPSEIVDRKGLWTIFAEPYTEIPPADGWQDIRADRGPGVYVGEPIRWETNWAAVPREILYDSRLSWDTEYDKAVAYENVDFAFQADQYGYKVLVDTDNHAVGLPHKSYFPEQETDEAPMTEINRELLARKTGIR